MDRFNSNLGEEIKKFKYVDRPRGRPQDQADVAVDAIIRLCLGLKDGEDVSEEDAGLIEDAVCGGMLGAGPQFREVVKKSIASRGERATVYA